jgi:hypothetical protein
VIATHLTGLNASHKGAGHGDPFIAKVDEKSSSGAQVQRHQKGEP